MSLASQDLPSDADALRALAAALQAQLAEKDLAIAARDAEIHAKTLHIEKLKAQLAVLRRARFGRSSEKLDQAIEQLELLIGELEEGEALTRSRAVPVGPSSERSPKPARAGGRQRLPEHLPRETVSHPAPRTCPGCGGTKLSMLGEDVSEVLEYVPSYLRSVTMVRGLLVLSRPRARRKKRLAACLGSLRDTCCQSVTELAPRQLRASILMRFGSPAPCM